MIRLLRFRSVLLRILDVIQEIAPRVRNLAELRARLAERIAAGDLDDAIAAFARADKAAEDFVRNG